jgi:hypothetical protein
VHEDRPQFDKRYDEFLTTHLGLAATALLCTVTEIQMYFRFNGADINSRIRQMWAVLMDLFFAKELYDEHYGALMKSLGIEPRD